LPKGIILFCHMASFRRPLFGGSCVRSVHEARWECEEAPRGFREHGQASARRTARLITKVMKLSLNARAAFVILARFVALVMPRAAPPP
jgi:hypothetical protein